MRRLNPDSEHIQELKTLHRDQDALPKQTTRLTNQLIACLKEYYPVALELFSRSTLPVALAFLRTYPTLEATRKALLPELVGFLKTHRQPGPISPRSAFIPSCTLCSSRPAPP